MICYDTFFNLPNTKVDWHMWTKLLHPIGEFYREDKNVGVLLDHCGEQRMSQKARLSIYHLIYVPSLNYSHEL